MTTKTPKRLTAVAIAKQLNKSPKVVRGWIRKNTKHKAPYAFTVIQAKKIFDGMTA